MLLGNPHMLWLLLLAAASVGVYRRQRTGSRRGSLVATVILRSLAMALLVLALARPVVLQPALRNVDVAVIDISQSVGDAALPALAKELASWLAAAADGGSSTRYGVVASDPPFLLRSEEIRPDSTWLRNLRTRTLKPDGANSATPLAAALELASTCFADGEHGTITLFSDGLATIGDTEAAAIRLGPRGIRLRTMACGDPRTNELVLVDAALPAQSRIGETVPLTLQLDAGRTGSADIVVTPRAGGPAVLRHTMNVRAGRQTITLPLPLDNAGVRSFDVRCQADWDADSSNNTALVATWAASPYSVAVLEANPAQPCTRNLSDLLGPSAKVRHLTTTDAIDATTLRDAHVLVIADTPAYDLSITTQQNIVSAVKRGLGLWYVGGPHGFGPGGYANSTLAEILPLDATEQAEKRDPSVTLVIIIDTSGSMKGPRIDLAKEVARLAIQRLQPHDKVGIVEFYGAKRWAARIQSAGNRIDINRALNRLSAGGGTIILPALEEAYYALLNVRTRTKHVLIITDGGVETGAFEDVITRMADAGITASTVVAGPGQYSGFLTSLAHWGQGKSYAAPDRFHLPEIILKQPEDLPASPYVEQPHALHAPRTDEILRDFVAADAPPLAGYVRTRARPTADLLLTTDNGAPLLARWRFGRGYVAAYAADLGGPWSQALTQWPPFGRLTANMVRQLASPADDDALRMQLLPRPAGVEIQVIYDGHQPPDLSTALRLIVQPPDGKRVEMVCDPLSPGVWNQLYTAPSPGVLTVEAQVPDGRSRGAAACGLSIIPEISATRPDSALLRRLEDLSRPTLAGRTHSTSVLAREMWPWCALAALAVLWLSVLARRWPGDGLRRAALISVLSMVTGVASASGAEPRPLADAILTGDAGDNAAAVALLQITADESDASSTSALLLAGLYAARAGQDADAQTFYAAAAASAPNHRDRAFALLMQIETARRAGGLSALADAWLADRTSVPERLPHLLAILREQGRVDDALSLLDVADNSAELQAIVQSEAFQHEIVATVLDAGRHEVAVEIYHRRIVESPNALPWRVALARLLLRAGQSPAAEQTLRDALEIATDMDTRIQVALAARRLALDSVAQDAMALAPTDDPADRLHAALWLADLHEQRGDRMAALAEIERGEQLAGDALGLLKKVADAYERFEQTGRAVALLEQIAQQAPDPALDERRAWLLENLRRYEDARQIWHHLWQNAATPARRQRAADRLLDLSAQTGVLADLTIELEGKLLDKSATSAEITLLVEVYTRLNDAVSTTEILYLFAEQEGHQLEAAQQLAHACIRMGRLAQADEALRQLLVLDPAHRFDHLQELAVLAVERGRPDIAEWAIAEMAGVTNDPVLREELSAGVYELLGDHARAAKAYAATLAAHPERIEIWLLWARAEQQTGRVDQAIVRLQRLAEQAEEDDLFLVAVDGLLNLEAPPTVLRKILQLVHRRSAAAPQKMFFYDVAADLLDALGQAEGINPLMERALVFAGAERGALLREMIERARSEGDSGRVITYGNLLVAMDYQVPPQVFLDLGRTLLSNGQTIEAERAFDRGRALGDDSTIGLQVADAFDDALLPARALAVVQELLAVDPSNLTLLHRAAALEEQLGDHAAAAQRYRRSLDLLAGRLPVTSDTSDVRLRSRTDGKGRRRIAANIDELNLFFDPTVDGMMVCARTAAERANVVALLKERTEAALHAVPDAPGRPFAEFPQLVRMAAALRHAAFAFHAPDVADAVDRSLLVRFPTDPALTELVIEERLRWGLAERALAIAREGIPWERWPATLHARELLNDDAQLAAALVDTSLSPDLAEHLVPRLIWAGRDEQARQLLTTPIAQWAPITARCARQMMIACAALDDLDLLQTWTTRYWDAARTGDARTVVAAATESVRLNWPLLDVGRKAALVQRLAEIAPAAPGAWSAIARLRLALAAELGVQLPDRAAILETFANQAGRNAAGIGDLLATLAPDTEQIPWLEKAWSRCTPDQQVPMLLHVAGRYTGPVSAELREAFERILAASTMIRLDRHAPYTELTRGGWSNNVVQPTLGGLCADRLLIAFPTESAVLVAAAEAFESADNHHRALPLARDAFQRILADREIDSEDVQMLHVVARYLPAAERDAFAARAMHMADADGGSTLELFAGGLLMAEAERDREALALLAAAFRRNPGDQRVRKSLLEHVEQSGRWRALPPLLEPYLANGAVMQSFEINRLAEAYRQCFRPTEALRVLQHDDGVMSRIGVLDLENMLGQQQRMRLRLRRYLAINRLEQRYYVPRTPPPPLPGGMKEYLLQQAPEYTHFRSMFAALATNPDVAAELDALWETAFPTRRDVPGLAAARVAAARRNHQVSTLAEELETQLAADTLQARDMRLLVELLFETDARIKLPAEFAAMPRGLVEGAADVAALEAWARMLIQANRSTDAAHILRWLVAGDLATPRRDIVSRDRLNRLDLYVNALPESARPSVESHLLSWSTLTPADDPSDSFDAALLERTAFRNFPTSTGEVHAAIARYLAHAPAGIYFPRIHRALAFTAALRRDTDAFQEQVDILLRLAGIAYGDMFPPDPMRFLPPARQLPDSAAFLAIVVARVHQAVEHGVLRHGDAVRVLILLGHWCRAQSPPLNDCTEQMLQAAVEQSGQAPRASLLWIADLAGELDSEKALDWQLQAFDAGVLPIIRIEQLLEALESLRGMEAADRFALEASRYTDHHRVLQRALQAARRAGDEEVSRRLEERFATVKAGEVGRRSD